MNRIAEFVFEAQMLKRIPRSGYQFLGIGNESVADHSFITTIIAWVMAQMEPRVEEDRLILMCLMHDLLEARIGDINYVQQEYIKKNEAKAMNSALNALPFGKKIRSVIEEFNNKQTLESKFANDADQIAFIIDLKCLADTGYSHTQSWIKNVKSRLTTSVGKKILEEILLTESTSWWKKIFIDNNIS